MKTPNSRPNLRPAFIRTAITIMVAMFTICLMVSDVNADEIGEESPYAFDAKESGRKVRIALVSSYHRGDTWDADVTRGIVVKLLELGYLDNTQQSDDLNRNDRVESQRANIRKWWMDGKRRKTIAEIANTLKTILPEIDVFGPDILVLGDDLATKHIGNYFLDTTIPVVFYGVNGTPVKYDLLDSADKPGHNVTGVYQSVYQINAMEKLAAFVPNLRTAAVISDDTATGRASNKVLRMHQEKGALPLKIKEYIITNDIDALKQAVFRLNSAVDALIVTTVATFKDHRGELIPREVVAEWIATQSKLPEISLNRQYVGYGLFCAVNDSGFAQGLLGIKVMDEILKGRSRPETTPAVTPPPGKFFVNVDKARKLGLLKSARHAGIVDEFID
jgi:ABC-type uncharacterized transport system substrate-binding protein